MSYLSLNLDNIKRVYEFIERNEKFYSISFDYFKKGTLDDKDFDPNLTIILENRDTRGILALFIALIRSIDTKKFCYLKVCLVDRNFRRQGLGTQLLDEMISRARERGIEAISYGDSTPNYWQPGVDLRHTSLYFFLKKHSFHSYKMRQNLTVDLETHEIIPRKNYREFSLERIQKEDFQNLFIFVKENFPEGTWAEEVALSLDLVPPTSFVAKDLNGNIIGWSTHSQLFSGSFGPTGVLQSLRGKGIGTELLKWALWDMKRNRIKKATIMWVVGDTVKYYSKAIDAYICPVFIPMRKKLS
jgi:GNAT superfamily N-acetyltransferase